MTRRLSAVLAGLLVAVVLASTARATSILNFAVVNTPSSTPQTTFETGSRGVGIRFTLDGLPANSTYRFRYLRPNGSIALDSGVISLHNAATGGFVQWWGYWPWLDMAGRWRILVDVNGITLVDANFDAVTIPPSTTKYAVRDLGTFGGAGEPWGINAAGQVTGFANRVDPYIPNGNHAFRYSPWNGLEDYNALPGTPSGFGQGINRSGQFVGYSINGFGVGQGFLYNNSAMVALGTMPGYTRESLAYGINDSGEVVGYSASTGGIAHAFLYKTGAFTDLGTLGGLNSIGIAVNANGTVTGWSGTAFLWRPTQAHGTTGSMVDLGALHPGYYSFPNAINDHNQVVGHSGPTGVNAESRTGSSLPGYHAFLATQVGMTDLGTLGGTNSVAYGINNDGDIVGGSEYAAGNSQRHAFLRSAGGLVDLNHEIHDPSWTLLEARAINDAGEITGVGLHNGLQTTFVLMPVVYDVQDLGTLGGTFSEAYSVNNAGQVAGYAYTAGNAARHAFVWQDGVMTDLGTLGGSSSTGNAINDAGQIAGQADTFPFDEPFAFLWQNGTMTDLGALPGGIISQAYGINGSRIVGYSLAGDFATSHAFLWQDGLMTDLGTLGGSSSVASSVNSVGQVAGYAYPAGSSAYHAFLWQGGLMTDLGTLGGSSSLALSINNTGQVVGRAYPPGNASYHAFLWQNGLMSDLGTLGGAYSEAYSVNSSGETVGDSDRPAGSPGGAFLRADQTMVALDGLIDPSSTWFLPRAYNTNDVGEIVGSGQSAGNGTNPGQTHAYLLKPYPVISNVRSTVHPLFSGASTATVAITWNTKVASDSLVDYGVSKAYGSSVTGASGLTHAVTLPPLSEGVYHFRVHSTDSFDRTAVSGDRTFTVDLSPPVTSLSLSGPAGLNGWYQGPVLASLSAADSLSSLAGTVYSLDGGVQQNYSGPITISSDGVHQLAYWSMDAAGNRETTKSQTVKIDGAPPTTTAAVSGPAGTNGWYRGAVSVALTPADATSGIAATYYTVDRGAQQTYAAPFTVSADAVHTVNFWSVDQAGNEESPHPSKTVEIDGTAPLTVALPDPAPNTAGWNNSNVSVSLAADDAGSGIAETYYRIDGGSPQLYTDAVTLSDDGRHTVEYWSVDEAGNEESPHGSLPAWIDKTPPTIVAPDVSATATRAGGADATYAPTASDALSGLAGSLVTSLPSGSPFPLGKTTVVCTAADAAGNVATKSFTVWVSFSWSGVLQPVNPDGSSVFRAGQPVPLKFKLTGASGGITDAVANLFYTRVDDATGTVNEGDQQGNADAGNQFRYDAANHQYVFNLSTKGLVAGKYRLIIDLHDGVARTVEIGLR